MVANDIENIIYRCFLKRKGIHKYIIIREGAIVVDKKQLVYIVYSARFIVFAKVNKQ